MTVEDLATYLHYTMDELDAGYRKRLEACLKEGKVYISKLLGLPAPDYVEEGLPRTLLKNWCRYDLNNAAEYFETNFSKEILRAQLEVAKDEATG